MNHNEMYAAITVLIGAAFAWRLYIALDKRKRPWEHPCDCEKLCTRCKDHLKRNRYNV